MRILVSTFGVRGDVQPYLAQAVGLKDAGHRVTLATAESFTPWIEAYGVSTHPTSFNMQAAMQTPEAQAIAKSNNYLRQVRLLRDAMSRSLETQDATWDAIQDADLVIQSPTGTSALEATSQRGIPAVFALPVPLRPCASFPRSSWVRCATRRALDAPPAWQAPEALLRFLESGPPPVYIGFGSMSIGNPERQTRFALAALELSGQRGVLSTGWGGVTRQTAPSNVCFVDDVPHRWLFPHMAAVVHHGGAGTTGASLRAGVPNVIAPFSPNDQPAWAERVAALGVGLRLPGIKKLTTEKLADAMQIAETDTALRARAAALGETIRAEDGVARAIELIERHAAGFGQRAHGS